MKIEFTALGTPQTQGSKKAFSWIDKKSGKARASMVESAGNKLKSWRSAVSDAARDAMAGHPMIGGPARVAYGFFFLRPKSHYRTGKNSHLLKSGADSWPVTKPDLDKLIRAVNDAMSGVVYRDDKLIVSMEPCKLWCAPGEPERVEVVVETT